MIEISQAHNEARLAGSRTDLDSGPAKARIEIFGTARPAFAVDPGAPALSTITLTKPSGMIVNNTLVLTADGDGLNLNSGGAVWARIFNGNNEASMDCDVSDEEGDGELKIASTTLFAGGSTRLISGVLE